jgi:AsmA-like C-terminal region
MKKRITISLAVLVVLLAVAVTLVLLRPTISLFVRNRMQSSLSDRFESQVTFSGYRFSLFPLPSATVTDLTLRHRNRTDVPPLIHIAELEMSVNWSGLVGPRFHVRNVQLNGLQLTFPPKRNGIPSDENPQGGEAAAHQLRIDLHSKFPVFIERIVADDATITILRAQPEKKPLVYPLHHLLLKNVSFDGPAEFEATLTNAVPRGEIISKGSFGPWDADNPRATAVNGSYKFEHADMTTIKGLEGTLSSTGTFVGPLDYLDVKGNTFIPDFTLRRVGNPLALRTEFSATVDGTNGNTYLHSVEAQFLHSRLSTKGEVVDLEKNVRGRTINLDTQSNDARAEDLIRLAVKTDSPVLNGPVKLDAKIRIPEEEDGDLSDRLDVQAQFVLTQGHFSNPQVQGKIDALSRKGQGDPKNMEIEHVPSALTASMHLQKAIITFSNIRFDVPGARLDLQGTYALGNGDLDFNGDLYLDAKLSQTTTGAKSFFLKAIDPFFRGKNGGSRIPVKVAGTKDHPTLGLGHKKEAKSPDNHQSANFN